MCFQMGSVLSGCMCISLIFLIHSFCIMFSNKLPTFVISCVLLARMFLNSASYVSSMDSMFVCMRLCFHLFCYLPCSRSVIEHIFPMDSMFSGCVRIFKRFASYHVFWVCLSLLFPWIYVFWMRLCFHLFC